MSEEAPQIQSQLFELGNLVASWNTLEWQLRTLVIGLAPHKLTAGLLISDLQTSSLINIARLFAKENDATLASIIEKPHKDVISLDRLSPLPHVEHFLTGVDRLREYRNHYVHNATISNPGPPRLIYQRITARRRLSAATGDISDAELKATTSKITEFSEYGARIYEANRILSDDDDPGLPSWPEKPLLPDRLETPHTNLIDAVLQQNASQE